MDDFVQQTRNTALDGGRIDRQAALRLLAADPDSLFEAADKIRRHFLGKGRIFLCFAFCRFFFCCLPLCRKAFGFFLAAKRGARYFFFQCGLLIAAVFAGKGYRAEKPVDIIRHIAKKSVDLLGNARGRPSRLCGLRNLYCI